MKEAEREGFRNTVWQHFELHGRHELPWRIPELDGSFDAYKILVSEIMLQQTQVPRVISKYAEFLDKFPDVTSLANSPLGDVLNAWSGLGYNRRAKFLWQAAQTVAHDFDGKFPQITDDLVSLPGVGKNTAAAVMAYAFNQPVPFVETNIRTVFIYHFFQGRDDVSDKEILELVNHTLDTANPRIWYWALMDYGSFLKQTIGNLNKLSKSYSRQAPFAGSRRQVRGQIIKLLGTKPLSKSQLGEHISDDRLDAVIDDLLREAMITKTGSRYSLY